MQPASQRLRAMPVPLIVTLLIAQALATACLGCSQPTSRLTRHRCETVALHAGIFCEICHFLVTTTPLDIKPSRCFCTWSVHVCSVQNFAIMRHGISEEIDRRQNKQTLKYLVDKIRLRLCATGLLTKGCRCNRMADWQRNNMVEIRTPLELISNDT